MDGYFRAVDLESGKELWSTKLPRAGIATPMTYQAADGRQIIVIAAGGHGKMGLPPGDHVVAFALPASTRSVTGEQVTRLNTHFCICHSRIASSG